jgi:hypothetical protein
MEEPVDELDALDALALVLPVDPPAPEEEEALALEEEADADEGAVEESPASEESSPEQPLIPALRSKPDAISANRERDLCFTVILLGKIYLCRSFTERESRFVSYPPLACPRASSIRGFISRINAVHLHRSGVASALRRARLGALNGGHAKVVCAPSAPAPARANP